MQTIRKSEENRNVLEIAFPGHHRSDGSENVIRIEEVDGEVMVYVYGDTTSSLPTHIISMAGAKVSDTGNDKIGQEAKWSGS